MMPQVAIESLDEKSAADTSVVDEMETLADRIRRRASESFERRGASHGSAVNDWLTAERDLFCVPESELVESDGKFVPRVSAPGIDPADVTVTALPDAPIVKGSTVHKHEQTDGDVRFCEFDQRTLFRRFDLPERNAATDGAQIGAAIGKRKKPESRLSSKGSTRGVRRRKCPMSPGHALCGSGVNQGLIGIFKRVWRKQPGLLRHFLRNSVISATPG